MIVQKICFVAGNGRERAVVAWPDFSPPRSTKQHCAFRQRNGKDFRRAGEIEYERSVQWHLSPELLDGFG